MDLNFLRDNENDAHELSVPVRRTASAAVFVSET
jgi:hypothetical protein